MRRGFIRRTGLLVETLAIVFSFKYVFLTAPKISQLAQNIPGDKTYYPPPPLFQKLYRSLKILVSKVNSLT